MNLDIYLRKMFRVRPEKLQLRNIRQNLFCVFIYFLHTFVILSCISYEISIAIPVITEILK